MSSFIPAHFSLKNLFFVLDVKALAETLHPTGCVQHALLASKEWMAL